MGPTVNSKSSTIEPPRSTFACHRLTKRTAWDVHVLMFDTDGVNTHFFRDEFNRIIAIVQIAKDQSIIITLTRTLEFYLHDFTILQMTRRTRHVRTHVEG